MSDTTDILRGRFRELAEQEGIDTSGVQLSESPRGYLRIQGPNGIDVEAWGNSGVREAIDAIAGTTLGGGSNPASQSTSNAREDVIEAVAETPVRIAGEADAEALAEFPSLESDRTFVSRQGDRISVTVYDENRNSPDNRFPTLEFSSGGRLNQFVEGIRTLGPEGVRAALDGATADEELYEEAAGREERRAIREAGRDVLPEVVDNPEEFDIGASDGRLVLQDADTGRTETVDVSGPGEVGTAIDAAAGDLAPEADGPGGGPAPAGSGSDDSLTAAAAAVVVTLVGLALAWVGGT